MKKRKSTDSTKTTQPKAKKPSQVSPRSAQRYSAKVQKKKIDALEAEVLKTFETIQDDEGQYDTADDRDRQEPKDVSTIIEESETKDMIASGELEFPPQTETLAQGDMLADSDLAEREPVSDLAERLDEQEQDKLIR